MEWLGWMKRVKPMGKQPIQRSENPENELVDLIKKGKTTRWVKCELDCTNLKKVLHVFTALMATGKTGMASELCKQLAESCFEPKPENPYRLLFLTFAMVADCETRYYDLNIFPLTRKDTSLKLRYSLCQEACVGILDMEPAIFKISELLTMCEELAHFSCFRQCHVNLLKNLSEIGPDESVDWFDRAKVLDSNILALINDSDIAFRLCDTAQEKKEFYTNLQKAQGSFNQHDQLCFSWFNNLHHREICVRSVAATEVLKLEMAYQNHVLRNRFTPRRRLYQLVVNTKRIERYHKRKLQPKHPELEDLSSQAPSVSNARTVADTALVTVKKDSKPLSKSKKFTPQKIYSTDTDGINYCISLFDDCKSFSDVNADSVDRKNRERKEREKKFNAGGPPDDRRKMTDDQRRKIRMVLRKMMSEGRELQKKQVSADALMDKAFPVSDDECSDEEVAPHPFIRTENLDNLRRKKLRKFGKLNPKSDVRQILWWQNARDELLTTRAIPNHCTKSTGGSSEPLATFEAYMGVNENGEQRRDRMTELSRVADCRQFNAKRELGTDDGVLLTMPSIDPFKDWNVESAKALETVGLKSLLLQNMRRRCIDELLIILMIIKGQQQLQDGNVIRCLAYIMLIDYKFSVFRENSDYPPTKDTNFYLHLVRLRKHLFSKFRLYGSDLFGTSCTSMGEELSLCEEGGEDFNLKCFQFCRDTRAYFFCICIRGKVIELKTNEQGESAYVLDRQDVEEQHEFFFSLDNGNKGALLSQFWSTECMPIVAGLVQMVNPTLAEQIDDMDPIEAQKVLDDIHGLSSQTKKWLKQITKNGFLKHKERVDAKEINENAKKLVPMLFQLPSKANTEHNTNDMIDVRDLDLIRQVTTEFVREKYTGWKEACKADKESLRKTNKDQMYNSERDLMFYGEAIEKDVYMVAVYKGEKMLEEGHTISSKMNLLCQKLRSQAAFITAPSCHTEEGSTD